MRQAEGTGDQTQTLTAEEALAIPRFLQQAATVTTLADFRDLVEEELPRLFPHAIMICGLGHIAPDNTVHAVRILNFGFPMDYLHAMRAPDGTLCSPIVRRWMEIGKPQLYTEDQMDADLPHDWRERFKRFGLGNLAAHGLIDRRRRQMSYFNFCSMPFELNAHYAFLLELLVPSLHAALLQIIAEAPPLGIETDTHAP